MVAFGGASPVIVEYDIDFPASGAYTLEIKYAAAEARPVELQMDDKTVAQVCRKATGGWETSKATCEKSAQLYIPAGPRTFRLQRAGAFPHLVSLRFTAEEIPANWVVNRPKARKLSDGPPRPVFVPYEPEVNTAALRRAIAHLQGTFGERYGKAAGFLKRLEEIESLPGEDEATRRAFARLQREALVESNPVVRFRSPAAHQARHTGPGPGLALQLAEQFIPADARLRRRALPAGLQAGRRPRWRRFSSRARTCLWVMWTCIGTRAKCCFPRWAPTAAGRCLRCSLREAGRRRCASSPASSRTWTATTPATCPTAGSSSRPPPVSSACRASTAARTWPTSTGWTPTAGTSASFASTRSTTGARRC